TLLEQVPEWRKGTRPDEPVEGMPSLTTAAVRSSADTHSRPWKLVALLGVALLLGTILAAVLGRPSTFQVELLSEPTGASGEVDGPGAPATAPLLTPPAAAARPHRLRPTLPGRPEGTGKIPGRSGTTVPPRPELPPPPQAGGDSPAPP